MRLSCPSAIMMLLIFTAACSAPSPNLPADTQAPPSAETSPRSPTRTAATAPPSMSPEVTPFPTEQPATQPPQAQVSLAPPQPPVGPQLAFLKEGDIWLLDQPDSRPYQLTLAGDISSFAWSPDGERLAAFNGKALCLFQRDGSVRTACLELGLTAEQAQIDREIVWSPDQAWIALWNDENPWDENSIGWLLVALDTSNAMWRIQDPVDWGAAMAPNNEPGGVTGQPIFLPNGRLLGTLTHRYLCSSGGCRYQLYEFDLSELNPSFVPVPNQPEEGWSEGQHLSLSSDGKILTNYGAFLFNCDSYQTFLDRFNLDTAEREAYHLEKQAVSHADISPNAAAAILARTAGCSQPEDTAWNQICGLSQGFEVLPIQLWDFSEPPADVLPPGIDPHWSPDAKWVVFNSCLQENDDGWEVDDTGKPGIYLSNFDAVVFIETGTQPAWRPNP